MFVHIAAFRHHRNLSGYGSCSMWWTVALLMSMLNIKTVDAFSISIEAYPEWLLCMAKPMGLWKIASFLMSGVSSKSLNFGVVFISDL